VWYGPVLGAALLTALPEILRGIGVTAGPIRMFVNGLILLIVILFLPNGLVSLFQHRKTVDASVLAGVRPGEE
jgi:branched-chain amino acid transport system permease protein